MTHVVLTEKEHGIASRHKEHFWMLRGVAHTTWCITRVPTFLFYLAKYIIAPRANMIINNNNNNNKMVKNQKCPLSLG